MEPTNLVILMSDEHSRHLLGGLGNPLAPTPNLDRLAARGTSFSQAYCTSPLCIPSRASLATGLYTFQHRCWDNAAPYDGSIPAWGHRAQAAGHRAQSIGKLSYRELHAANGFDEEIYPLPLADGVGDLLGLIRDELPQRKKYRDYVVGAGPRETKYTLYDRRVAEAAVRWLHEQAPRYAAKPWVLYVGFFCPHPPFNAPPEFFERVRDLDVPWPVQHGGR
ncbi:MAG: sulfatase-like hydrolase/transferase, partial [Candidatus Lambdaproteobacteria bacterium]|nr:sulfatase-like hydrolase/transferase [Candidatus Lambdaproteobacteria bacterium]